MIITIGVPGDSVGLGWEVLYCCSQGMQLFMDWGLPALILVYMGWDGALVQGQGIGMWLSLCVSWGFICSVGFLETVSCWIGQMCSEVLWNFCLGLNGITSWVEAFLMMV